MTVFTATDPATGRVIRQVEPTSGEEIEHVIARSLTAYQDWRATSFDDRAATLRAVAQRMQNDRERLSSLITEEMGKPIVEARGEIDKAVWAAEHYAENAAVYLATDVLPSDATRSHVQYLPLGPLLGVMPFNSPFWLAFRFCAPALMAGNTCVIKHDDHMPGCAMALAELFEDAQGAPPGLLQVIFTDHAGTERVIRDPAIRGVSVTASERAGAAIGSIAGSELKPVVLELGGSDPAIVLKDADLEQAVDMIATMRLIAGGQSCIAAKRMVVEAAVHDEFVELFEDRLAGVVVGDPWDESTEVGPIARGDLRANLHRQVTETVEAGARLRLGGELPDGDGFYYPVTLLTGVTMDMTAGREETFGPVAAVIEVADETEALAVANDSPYGLAASIWTSPERGAELAHQIEAGQVAVNGLVKTDPRLPTGGIKRSGFGRELGPHGIREFVNAQQVWVGPAQPG